VHNCGAVDLNVNVWIVFEELIIISCEYGFKNTKF
jgi:hypothetical protein